MFNFTYAISVITGFKKAKEIEDNIQEELRANDKKFEKEKSKYELEKEERRLVWEKENDLKKRIDACYLGFRHEAFYGTYEEFLNRTNRFMPIPNMNNMFRDQSLANAQAAAYNRYVYNPTNGSCFPF